MIMTFMHGLVTVSYGSWTGSLKDGGWDCQLGIWAWDCGYLDENMKLHWLITLGLMHSFTNTFMYRIWISTFKETRRWEFSMIFPYSAGQKPRLKPTQPLASPSSSINSFPTDTIVGKSCTSTCSFDPKSTTLTASTPTTPIPRVNIRISTE